ncbi:Imm8 family immunity protein [Brevibacillus porteri]|uniref:Imm8 family immunity protein n=1 Tax=Brevibacillus porteri TaxID=2126350 RepID=UPI003D208266
MLVVKSLIQSYEDWGTDLDDFYISFEVDIGCKDIIGSADMFTFEVVSPKRLSKIVSDSNIEIGRGYLIMNDFNINQVQQVVNNIVKKCQNEDYNLAMKDISKYFRWQMDN